MSEEDPALDSSAKLEEFSVVHSSGEVRTEFTVGLLPAALTEGPQIQVILIGKLEGKVLVGFPFSAWHRLRDRRSLQNFNFAKPTAVEVLVVREDNMEDVVEGKVMKIWIGFVNQEVLDSMMFGEDASQAEHNFGRGGLEGCLPSARSLADVAEQHFSFLSAMSEPARADERREGESGLEGLSSRMSQLEASVGTIASSLKELLSHQKPSGTSSHSQGRQTSFVAPTPKQAASSMTNLYPSLDQGAVNAALQSGVPREALAQMESLVSRGALGRKKLPDPYMGKPRAVVTDSEEEEQQGDGSGSPHEPSDPISASLVKLTSIVESLAESKKGKSGSKLEAVLESGHGTSVDGVGTGGGKRLAAAWRALRTALKDSPTEIYSHLEQLMAEDLMSVTLTPGQPLPTFSARAWVEHRSRIGSYRTSAHSAWSTAGALDCLVRGDAAGCRARLCLLLLQLDQTACDRGSWSLSSDLSLEPGPPLTHCTETSRSQGCWIRGGQRFQLLTSKTPTPT